MIQFWPVVERIAQRNLGKGVRGNTTSSEVRELLRFVPRPEVVVDVGGHHGEWASELLRRGHPTRLLVIEPDAGNCVALRRKFSENSAVEVVEAALDTVDGERTLYADEPGSGLASLHRRDLSEHGLRHEPVGTVRTISWDSFTRRANLDRLDVLKMDIEGHEFEVLLSMGNWINRVGILQFEFGGCNVDSRTYFRDFWKLLAPQFEFHRISARKLVPVLSYREQDETFVTTNYLCVNRDHY